MRVSSKKVNATLKKQIDVAFNQLLSDLGDPEDVNKFLSDFLNDSEYEMLTKRLAVAYWLRKGRSYKNIKENLKVSSATIATVQSTMDTPGMQLAIKYLEAEEWSNKWADKFFKIRGKGKN